MNLVKLMCSKKSKKIFQLLDLLPSLLGSVTTYSHDAISANMTLFDGKNLENLFLFSDSRVNKFATHVYPACFKEKKFFWKNQRIHCNGERLENIKAIARSVITENFRYTEWQPFKSNHKKNYGILKQLFNYSESAKTNPGSFEKKNIYSDFIDIAEELQSFLPSF